MAKKILTDLQKKLLGVIGKNKFIAANFYLTGGTALAAFYLHHRYSEDLDFFSEQEVDLLQLDITLKGLQKELKVSKLDYQQSYNRNLFFLHFGPEVIKTEFTYFPFPRIEKSHLEYALQIDSLIDIATNKLFSIYQRSQARDYIDLYCILRQQHWTIEELIKKTKAKFDWHIDPLQLGAQFLKTSEAKDYPHMITEIKAEQWQVFFTEQAKILKLAVLE